LRSPLWIFTSLAIFVGCLGRFGLATYAAENRKKEAGIRKVLGAGVGRVVLPLSVDFIKLVMVSLVIASPVAWYFMNSWLNSCVKAGLRSDGAPAILCQCCLPVRLFVYRLFYIK
jgi:hypothetical protein